MLFQQSIRAAALLATLPLVLAQTYTTCNPLTATCPADTGLSSSSYSRDWTSQDFTNWNLSSSTMITRDSSGAEFTIVADGQDPTLSSNFYIFFGRVDVVMKAAPGVGIVSSIVLESDDLDEIDWEILGGDTTQAQSNFFGKGDTTTYDRGAYHPVTAPQTTYHTYSIDWTSDRIQWLIDNTVVREVAYSAASASNGAKYPQTPSRVKLGNWVAGGAANAPGTVQWAGGKTDFSQAPFIMTVKSISITNYNPAASYSYGDHTGSFGSIVKNGAVSGGNPVVSSSSTTSASSASTTSSSTISTSSTSTIATSSTTAVANKVGTSSATTSGSTTAPVTTSTTTVTAASSGAVVSKSASSGFVSSSRTSSSASATTSGPVMQTGNSAASLSITTAGSLLSLAAAFFVF